MRDNGATGQYGALVHAIIRYPPGIDLDEPPSMQELLDSYRHYFGAAAMPWTFDR